MNDKDDATFKLKKNIFKIFLVKFCKSVFYIVNERIWQIFKNF